MGGKIAQALCILNLFGRLTTALTNVDGAPRLQPGETTHQGSGHSDVCSTYTNSTSIHCIFQLLHCENADRLGRELCSEDARFLGKWVHAFASALNVTLLRCWSSDFRASTGLTSWSSVTLPDFMFLSQAEYRRTSCPFVHLGTWHTCDRNMGALSRAGHKSPWEPCCTPVAPAPPMQ